METENKDWKPRVGEPAWVIDRRGNTPRIVHAIISITHELQHPPRVDCWIHGWGWVEAFESPEAALASIRVYDLEGKEVLIPRAIHFSGICSECGSSIALDAKQTNAMEKLAEAAYNMQFGGGAAIGGKSDQRAGGC